MAKKSNGKGDKKAHKKAGSGHGKIRKSKEHRGCGPLGYYLRFGVSKRDALCGGVKPLSKQHS